MWLEDWELPDQIIASDASCWGMCGDQFFHHKFPEEILQGDHHIVRLELLTIMVVVRLWASKLKGRNICFYCDNSGST